MMRPLVLGVLLVSALTFAQDLPSDTVAVGRSTPPSKTQQPADIDARVMIQTDVLLAFVSLGVGADIGAFRLGRGTVALGAELEVSVCGTFCLLFGSLTDTSLSNLYFAPHARVSYHLLPTRKGGKGFEKLDLYALALAGATYTRTRFTGDGWDWKGSDTGLSVGAGAGVKYFFRDTTFVGAEGRLRYSQGTYAYSVQTGTVQETGAYDSWSLTGLQLMFFIGARF